ncbi:MAG: hypothetical protein R3B48_30875 [Kofleriaceae bacterium]
MSARGAEVLDQLVGAGPRALLEALAERGSAAAKAARARPDVECYLAGGQIVRGKVLSVAPERTGPIAVLHIGGPPSAPSVAYVCVEQVVAVVVADASVLVRAAHADAPTPSRLELVRQLEARAGHLAGSLGRALPLTLAPNPDDDARRALGEALPTVASVLGAIAADELGKGALGTLSAVELGVGPALELWLEDPRRLVVRVPLLGGEPLTARGLREAIERLL